MPFQVEDPLIQRYNLEKTDQRFGVESDATYVEVIKANQGEQEQRAAVYAEVERVLGPKDGDEIKLRQRWSPDELTRREIYLTMRGCNITYKGAPLFRFRQGSDGIPVLAMTEGEFKDALGKLPPFVVTEIHEMVLRHNPQWDGLKGEGG